MSLISRRVSSLENNEFTTPLYIPGLNLPIRSSVKSGTFFGCVETGVFGFSKSVALELGSRNIRCNVIAPGFIETEMTAKLNEEVVKGWRDAIPLKRGGSTEDVANACLFFASDMSSFVTGQVLNVCGGMLT